MSSSWKSCISTLDPANRGGVLSMMKAVYRTLERWGGTSRLLYLSINPDDSLRIRALARGNLSWRVKECNQEGMWGLSVGFLLPEVEFLHYLLPYRRMCDFINTCDVFITVSGTNIASLPFILSRKRFLCWIATTFREERLAKAAEMPPNFLSNLLNRLSIPVLTWMERWIYRRAEVILALSQYTAANIIRICPSVSARVQVLPFPVDTERFTPILGYRRSGPMTLLFTARYNDVRKNVPMLLHAFHIIRTKRDDVRLCLVGDNPSPELLTLTGELGLVGDVDFIGHQVGDAFIDYYRNADIFVLPSLQEGLGISILEAMACGLPVVATRCGGPEHIVVDGTTGFLVPNNDQEAFAAAVLQLLEDPDLRSRMGRAGVLRIQHFSTAIFEDTLHTAFRSVYPEIFSGD